MPIFPAFLSIAAYPRFHSEETGRPFERCLICETVLLGGGDPDYVIEKAYRCRPDLGAEELVFEYALCMACVEAMEATFSESSRTHIERFYADRVDLDARAVRLLQRPARRLADWTGTCMVNGTPVADLDEYQLVAHARGGRLVVGAAPGILGGAAIDELAAGLSAHTLGEARRFRDDFLGLPPELEDLLRDRYLV